MDETLDSYYLFGLEALQERLPALANEIEGVRAAEDIEYVHRMRVASRRIRNALVLFGDELPRKHYAVLRNEMRLPAWPCWQTGPWSRCYRMHLSKRVGMCGYW